MKIVQDRVYFKVILFGSALAGKTTTLEWLYGHMVPEEMKVTEGIHSIKTSFGQTLLFDFVPIQAASNITFRIYALTGQDYYVSTRRMFFEDVDGMFFVIDSQEAEVEHNREFVRELDSYRQAFPPLREAAVVILYNKQDLPGALAPERLAAELGLGEFSSFAVSAVTGANLPQAFTHLVGLVLDRLRREKESADGI